MRSKRSIQPEINFQPSTLKITNEYYEKYELVSRALDDNPNIIELVHQDLKDPLKYAAVEDRHGSQCAYTTDTVLRILLCQIIEGASLRAITIRIDDSNFLRWFVRVYNGPMMDFTTLDKLKNSIRPKTWKKINQALARYAVGLGGLSGTTLRLDTTAVETNIHWPTDSSLLWDTYRVQGRLIEQAREIDAKAVGDRRVLKTKAKKLYTKISRQASKKPGSTESLKPLYAQLIRLVEGLLEWSASVASALDKGIAKGRYAFLETGQAEILADDLRGIGELGYQVVTQASRRVLHNESVPNAEKVFSIFEPHTELLKRGKAGKAIEFGHMIQIQQVEQKFITDYDVFEKKPNEVKLLEPAIESHKKLFGEYPETVSADKGYYDTQVIKSVRTKVDLVSISKKGRRSEAETEQETNEQFRYAQRFRAGVEGSISFLKRILGLNRCYNKGWEHYACTIGATVLAHNLLILARS